jgi:spore photoproduct lyase
MDIAKKFKPQTILLWQKVAEHPESQRILGLFPTAEVRIVKHQRYSFPPQMSFAESLLTGKRYLMIGQTSSFVQKFDGELGYGVHCLPYYKLTPLSNGCPYYCTYCYLAFVYRKYSPFIKLNINYDAMFKQIHKTIANSSGPITFNMGEMLDSLALDHVTNLTQMLIPFFSGFSRAYLMLLTKSCNIDNLLTIEPNSRTIVSWSLNSKSAIETYEPGTASLDERINAARLCQNHGYRIRIRIDPAIFHPDWQCGYAELVKKVFAALRPENITLGMLRLLPGHLRLAVSAYGNRAKTLSQHKLISGATDNKLRYPPHQRLEFYTYLIDIIRSIDKQVSISLCRETPEIWESLKDRCDRLKCNCQVW